MKLSLGAALAIMTFLVGCASADAVGSSSPEVKELLTLDGKFEYVADDHTGFGLKTATANEELVLDDSEKSIFTEGEKARVRGHRVTHSSGRKVVDVVDIVVCPRPAPGMDLAPIDCTTGPEHDEPESCANGDAKWLEDNCRGVVVFF